jgi:hypothetical protein
VLLRGERAPRDWRAFAALAIVSAAVAFGLTAALDLNPALRWAVRDVGAVAADGLPLVFFTGWISNLGVLGWFATATAGILAARVSYRHGERRAAAYTGGAGAIALLLGIDDLFMLHDGAIASGEEALLLLWLTLVLTWTVIFFRELIRDELLPVLVLAGAFFAHAVVADVLPRDVPTLLHEDASKLAAIILLTAWSWATAERTLHSLAPTTKTQDIPMKAGR